MKNTVCSKYAHKYISDSSHRSQISNIIQLFFVTQKNTYFWVIPILHRVHVEYKT